MTSGKSVLDKLESRHVPIKWSNVAAFRLSRHHLSNRVPPSALTSAVADIVGAQAQVLLAAQMSIWARVKGAGLRDVDSAIWKDRSLVRAWAMRRTMFVLPAEELAMFVRGTTRRAAYGLRYALSRIGSKAELDKLLDAVLEALREPRTRSDLAEILRKSLGYKLKTKAGGGWGNKRPVPWVEVGRASLPVGWLLHLIGARDVICSGPGDGNEASYVRADSWISHWKDLSVAEAEKRLVVRYLEAFGPATLQDFALWAGMYVRDAKEIWSHVVDKLVPVNVEGWKANILRSDLSELKEASIEKPIARLLPYFDCFLLGHKSHSNIVDERNRKKIYRNQGWVSPVVLVNGQAEGVWSHVQKRDRLEITILPFNKLSPGICSRLKEEASDLGRFLECTSVNTKIG